VERWEKDDIIAGLHRLEMGRCFLGVGTGISPGRGGRRMTLLLASADWKWGDASLALELVYCPGEAGEK
jgi:hypothetical protein